VAGTIEFEHRKYRALNVIGDYLVSVKSALGEHMNPRFQLKVPDSHKAIFYGLNHFELHTHASVAEQIVNWFYPNPTETEYGQVHEYMIGLDDLEGIALT
jgi:hypothetical protein